MKTILIALLTGLPAFCFAQTEGKATISGSLKNINNVRAVYYSYRSGDDVIRDSALVKDSKYQFTASGEMPLMIKMFSASPQADEIKAREVATVFVEGGMNTVVSVDSFSNVEIKESKAQADFKKITDAMKPFQEQINLLSSRYDDLNAMGDTAGMKKIAGEYEILDQKLKEEVYGAFIRTNPTSPLALFALNNYAGFDIDPVKVEPLYQLLADKYKNAPAGKKFGERLLKAKLTAVGAMAPGFSQADTSGKVVSLSSFKGKYVLVDFWASWCGPCRAENPNVVNAYHQYQNKNFTIVGVSLDDEKDKWLAAIARDKLSWTQLSDLKGWENAVARQYGIQAIPQNLLLDPAGKIIAKNIRGEELLQKLAEVLK